MARLLLLVPTSSYRTEDFMAAAAKLGIDLVLGTDQRQVLEDLSGGHMRSFDFEDPDRGARQIAALAEETPFDAILSVDDGANAVAASASAHLGLGHSPRKAVDQAKNKYYFRQALARAKLPSPPFALASVNQDSSQVARKVAQEIGFPCVIKPLSLAMSRGVIRADGDNSFAAAFARVGKIIAADDTITPGIAADHLLIEGYIPGDEYAMEALIQKGRLRPLAIFDKPNPLEGPYFEETIYVTPARLQASRKAAIIAAAQDAVDAIGLNDGPAHIDLRVNDDGVFIIEVDARSIGGRCGRSLRFAGDMRLEEVILRNALGLPLDAVENPDQAGGVMMIPIPKSGVLRAVAGLEAAQHVALISEASITIPIGGKVVELPEGGRYLGFIIAHGAEPEDVVAALRDAHDHLIFDIEDDPSA